MRWPVCLFGLLALLATAHHGFCGDCTAGDDRAAVVPDAPIADDDAIVDLDLPLEAVVFEEDLGEDIPEGIGVANDGLDDTSAAPKLSDEDEKTLKELIENAGKARRSQFKKELEKKSRDLSEKAALDKAGKEKFDTLLPKATDAAVAAWQEKCREWMMTYLTQSGDASAMLKNWTPESLSGGGNQNFAATAPDQTTVWKAGLKEILTPAQLNAIEEDEKARIAKVRTEMADYLGASESHASDTFSAQMDTALGRIERYGSIDEERRKKLKQAADEAVKLTTADWRTRAENQLLAMDESGRDQMAKNGGYMGVAITDKANQPQEQKVWKETLAKILTDAERKMIADSRAAVRSRRADALAMILIGDVDRLIGLSEEQRNALWKLSGKRMLALPVHYFDPQDSNGYYSLDSGLMMRQLDVIKDQIRPLLGERQVKRWEALGPEQLSRGGYVREKIDPGKLPPPEEMDEVEVERIVSGFLHREAKKMKEKMQAVMEGRVDSISRVASPAPEAVAVLNTAAKGAAEQMAQMSITNLASWVRGQFQNIKPADVPARLQNLYNPYFSERQAQADPERWTATVNRLLSEAQRKAWKAECDSRDAWRMRGLTDMVVTELEKRIILKPEQFEALRKKIAEVIKEYDTDFSNFFSYGWHLQGYYSMIPMAMLSEKELAELLDPKQAETVKEKCLGNATQYAEMIRRNHSARAGKK
jgi:hypothetical protein